MKKLFIVMFFIAGIDSVAFAVERGITPYGDFSPSCGNYGVCQGGMTDEEAMANITTYFHSKGLIIRNSSTTGRFIMVEIFRGHELVDKIILDRATGRIRSIY